MRDSERTFREAERAYQTAKDKTTEPIPVQLQPIWWAGRILDALGLVLNKLEDIEEAVSND